VPLPIRFATRRLARGLAAVAAVATVVACALPIGAVSATDAPDHLVVSEVVTGGASGSDELIELYNPTAAALPLEGLELIYVSSTGATVTRRAAWSLGAPSVPAWGHVLVANEAGIFATIADAVYATGMAATGGSVALRITGASPAIDAVGWGTAASTWREGASSVAPSAGASIERLPGGASGSTQDTDDNAADFVERLVPQPQNLTSPPTPGGGTPSPSSTPSVSSTASPTIEVTPTATPSTMPSATLAATPTATAAPNVLSVAAARGAADGTTVTVEATVIAGTDFHDGGGFVADATGGIAVIVEDGVAVRGARVRLTGEVDDRFSQRTLRTTAAEVVVLEPGAEPAPVTVTTGSIDEAVEGQLVSVAGSVVGAASTLTSGTAFDLDDGSGPIRLVVQTLTGIDVAAWTSGSVIELVGVVGQRDSTGTGLEGYRIMPRDPADITFVGVPDTSTPTPTPSASGPSDPTPTPSGSPEGVVTIAAARDASKNARLRIRGVVTLPSGVVDPQTAVIQDATGALVLRLSDEVGGLALGESIEVAGTRSTKSGMETLRVNEAPQRLGTGVVPAPTAVRTGGVGEALEARVVVASGAIVATARRASNGSISFEIDDGSGPLRVSLGSSLDGSAEPWTSGTWVEVTGVLGQETTGAQPLRGYRIWPRTADEVRVVAAATDEGASSADDGDGGTAGGSGGLDAIGGPDLAAMRVGATLVAGRWPELGIGGLLWDGSRLVAIAEASAGAITATRGSRPLPLALELAGMSSSGTEPHTGAAIMTLGTAPGDLVLGSGPVSPPRSTLAGEVPAWVSLVGRLEKGGATLRLSDQRVPVERRCDGPAGPSAGTVAVLGVAAGDPVRLIVPCGGIGAAPVIALGAGVARAADDAANSEAVLTADHAPAPPAPSAAAAALLALAALFLGGTAAWYWRRAPADEDAAGGPAAQEAPDAPPIPARLTLVSVPREHGP
jgi:uncharacterized protein YdeI (BOF family)